MTDAKQIRAAIRRAKDLHYRKKETVKTKDEEETGMDANLLAALHRIVEVSNRDGQYEFAIKLMREIALAAIAKAEK
jgi:hypothetical protein